MTGYDGELAKVVVLIFFLEAVHNNPKIDRLQFTVTSRKEMPNARFVEEIAKAADDLHALHTEVASVASTTTKPRL